MPFRTWLDQVALQDLSGRRRWSYLCFALAQFLALGSYQFITPVKTAIFFGVVGPAAEPVAKSLELVVLVPTLFCYGLLVSYLRNPRFLVCAACGFYGVVYVFIAAVLVIDEGHPRPLIAWVLYYTTETRGVVMMPMVWSVVNEKSTPECAAKAFPTVFFVIQLGGILGSFVAVNVGSLGGEVGLMLLQVAALAAISVLCWAACDLADGDDRGQPLIARGDAPERGHDTIRGGSGGPRTASGGDPPARRGCLRAGLTQVYSGVEGLWLLLSRPYVFLTFWVSYATLTPRTVLDYQSSVLVVAAHPDRNGQIAFFGHMFIVQNVCIAALTLLGTRFIVGSLGLGLSLFVLPFTMLLCVLVLCAHYGLWTAVCPLIFACVVAYGLNSPCKEMLYVRTSREIKYKAKSWSEMFGSEVMKLIGAQVNLWVNLQTEACAPHCFRPGATAGIVVGWVVLWAAAAGQLRRMHARLELEDGMVT